MVCPDVQKPYPTLSWDCWPLIWAESRRSHACCYRRCFARVVATWFYRIPRDVRSDTSTTRDRSRFVCSAFPDRTKRCRLKQNNRRRCLDPLAAKLIVAEIIDCGAGFRGFVGMLYLASFGARTQLAQRASQRRPYQGVWEPDPSLPTFGSPDPKSDSIIPTIGKAFVLDTTERIPTSMACRSKSALACCVKSTMGMAGAISAMRRAVSIPLIPGIWKSRITILGRSSLNISTAETPSAASPHISQSGLACKTMRRDRRTKSLSSTIRNRVRI